MPRDFSPVDSQDARKELDGRPLQIQDHCARQKQQILKDTSPPGHSKGHRPGLVEADPLRRRKRLVPRPGEDHLDQIQPKPGLPDLQHQLMRNFLGLELNLPRTVPNTPVLDPREANRVQNDGKPGSHHQVPPQPVWNPNPSHDDRFCKPAGPEHRPCGPNRRHRGARTGSRPALRPTRPSIPLRMTLGPPWQPVCPCSKR